MKTKTLMMLLNFTLTTVIFIPVSLHAGDLAGEPIWIYDSDLYVKHVETADLNSDGVPDVIAAEHNSDYYGELSKVIAIDGETGDTLWTYQLNDGVRSMTIGDLNNDGVMDVIAGASYNSTNTPDGKIHAINGVDGSSLWTYYTGATNEDVAVGKINGDAYPDVAVACFDDYVYAIDGATGALLWKRLIGSLWINAVAIADVNGDDIGDVAFAHEYLTGFDNYFGILDGTNGVPIWDSTVAYAVLDVLLADVDNDGDLEAVFGGVDSTDTGHLYVRSAIDGKLEWEYNLNHLDHVNGDINLHVYDIDNDADLDLIVGNYAGTNFIYAFDGDINTPMWISDTLDGFPRDIAFGEVTGDGNLNIIAATYDRVQVLEASDGSKVWYYAVGGTIASVAAGDFDNDGVTDVTAGGAAESSGIPPNPGKSVWALKTVTSPLLWEFNFGQYGNALAVDNLNGDQYMDVVVVASLDDKATAIDGANGTELWSWVGTENLFAVATGDFDNNGIADVAVGGWDNIITALSGDVGTLKWQFTTPTDDIYRKLLQTADLDGNGNVDVIAGSEDNHVYAIDGESGLQMWSTISFPSDVEEIELAQMNNSGPLDIVAAIGGTSGKMVVIDGESGDVLWEYSSNTAYAQHVEVLDANDDGTLDVAIGTQKIGATSGRIIVVDGVTHTPLWTVTPIQPSIEYGLSHGDLNGDKSDDLVVGGNSTDMTVYAFNGPDGSLLWSYPTGGEVNVVLVHEVTGDSIPDVLAGSDDQYLYVLNGNEGSVAFSYSTAGDVMHIQVGDISGDGVPNIACVTFDADGVAYAFASLYQPGCCIGIRGNVDSDGADQVNVADLTFLVDYLFRNGTVPPCAEEGDVNGDSNINVADLTYLVDYLFRNGTPPPSC
jgi:outer membrane protein assembly factor BamB